MGIYFKNLTDLVTYGETYTAISLTAGIDFENLLFDNQGDYQVEIRINRGKENETVLKLASGTYIELALTSVSSVEIKCSSAGHTCNVFYMLSGDKITGA
jgi:hypothetical protein